MKSDFAVTNRNKYGFGVRGARVVVHGFSIFSNYWKQRKFVGVRGHVRALDPGDMSPSP